MWVANAERCRKIDQIAEAEYGLTPKILMERAGGAVFNAIKEVMPEPGKISIVCGRGKNGGDGFVVARIAAEAGYEVECLVAGVAGTLCREAEEQLNLMVGSGVNPIYSDEPKFARKLECLSCREIIVDALLGTGARTAVAGPIEDAIKAINASGVPVVAIDIPSGIEADTGEELGDSVWALRTVTLGMPKPCFFEGMGLEHAGYWTVDDIGLPVQLLKDPTEAKLICDKKVADILPERLRAYHKVDSGMVLLIAGSYAMPGAAVMAAKAAYRAGAGMVLVASVPSVCQVISHHIPECLLVPLPEVDGVLAPKALDKIMETANRCGSAIFGPGLGHEEPTLDALSEIWARWELPSVIDADALNAVAMGVSLPLSDKIMTPHPGEMARLLKESAAEVQRDRFKSVRTAAEVYQSCVVLKGPHTLVTEPGAPVMVNQTGNPGMATAGMGDVLSGIIGTLLAQDVCPIEAASAGVFWHGEAGDICAREIGQIGFTATDLIEKIPSARSRIVDSL